MPVNVLGSAVAGASRLKSSVLHRPTPLVPAGRANNFRDMSLDAVSSSWGLGAALGK